MTVRLDPRHIAHAEFAGLDAAQPAAPEDLAYWEDFNHRFFRSNGLGYEASDTNVRAWLGAPERASFSAMVDALLPRLAEQVDVSDIDFIILAHWLPDLHLGTSVTNFAMHKLGLTDSFGFAISDRGRSAPLFALDCIDRYLRPERARALLMVMDQKHLLYRAPLVEMLEPANSAALMVLEHGGKTGLHLAGYRRATGVPVTAIAAKLRAWCAEFSLDPEATRVIADPMVLAHADHQGLVLAQSPRLMCSAPFAALSQCGGDMPTLLVGHEQDCLTGICLTPDPPRQPRPEGRT
ncbi:MAG: hypothetical protein ACRC14_05085 [Paracoccaceae bacterium]